MSKGIKASKKLDKMLADYRASKYYQRRRKIWDFERWVYKSLQWPKIPVLNVVWVFWTTLMEEGIVATCKPRWGVLTFAYLNDGMKPTLWHTIQQIFFHRGKYSGIWIYGAPKSKKDADKKLASYNEK